MCFDGLTPVELSLVVGVDGAECRWACSAFFWVCAAAFDGAGVVDGAGFAAGFDGTGWAAGAGASCLVCPGAEAEFPDTPPFPPPPPPPANAVPLNTASARASRA